MGESDSGRYRKSGRFSRIIRYFRRAYRPLSHSHPLPLSHSPIDIQRIFLVCSNDASLFDHFGGFEGLKSLLQFKIFFLKAIKKALFAQSWLVGLSGCGVVRLWGCPVVY